jgi:hypothetical protein
MLGRNQTFDEKCKISASQSGLIYLILYQGFVPWKSGVGEFR